MGLRPLEITLISAEGIKDASSIFRKMDVYAVASIAGYPKTKKKTKVDRRCGTSPRWNQNVQFIIDECCLCNPGLTLTIKLKARKTFRPDKTVGRVTIPIAELSRDVNDEIGTTAERVVEYQVTTSSGKPKGSLTVAHKFGEKLAFDNNGDRGNQPGDPVAMYPPLGYRQGEAGSSMPPPPAAKVGVAYTPPHPRMRYQQPPPGYGYPPTLSPTGGYYGAYPPPGGYSQSGYGYAPPQRYGYQQPVQPAKMNNRMGMGVGMGLGAGLLGGMLIGDMASDVGEMAAYNDGYQDAMGDVGDFGF